MAAYQLPMTPWIWIKENRPDDGQTGVYYFRKILSLAEKPEKAVVKISADSRYRFFVNGQSVAFGPCKGDGEVWYYEEVDLAPWLQAGENCLAAVVVHFSPLSRGNVSVWRTATPGFYLNGKIVSTGDEQDLKVDATWRAVRADPIQLGPEAIGMAYLNIAETVRADRRFQSWLTCDYDDSFWQDTQAYHLFAINASVGPANLHPRPIPPMFERPARLTGLVCRRQSNLQDQNWLNLIHGRGITIDAHQTEIVELDAGELTTGFLELKLAGGRDAAIEILTSECYAYETLQTSKMPQPRKGNRTDWQQGQLYGIHDLYQVAGFGTTDQLEYYEPFWFRTFRFIQLKITTGADPLQIADFSYRETGYPLEPVTEVTTTDPDFAGIWDISLRSLRRCMHETYEDCPFYEQLQYGMDTRAQILFTYNVAADDRMARRTIDDFHRSQRGEGLVGGCCPTVNSNVITGFSLFYIMMIHDHTMYFGDRQLVERYLPTVDRIIDYFHRNLDERGLVGQVGHVIGSRHWSFIDWTAQWSGTAGVPTAIWQGPLTVESLMVAATLTMAAELADFIERPEQAGRYRTRFADLRSAINQHCIGADGYYQDGPGVEDYSHHAQVWAVLSDVAPADTHEHLMRLTLDRPELARCSVAMSYYWYRALEKAGLYHETAQLWETWRQMLRENLTTCEEDPVGKRSDCHAWGALALYEFPSSVLGVRPAAPGYAKVEIRPRATWLGQAQGQVITPRGLIEVAWQMENGQIKLDYKVPEGLAVEIGII